jgi:hypothetical protein
MAKLTAFTLAAGLGMFGPRAAAFAGEARASSRGVGGIFDFIPAIISGVDQGAALAPQLAADFGDKSVQQQLATQSAETQATTLAQGQAAANAAAAPALAQAQGLDSAVKTAVLGLAAFGVLYLLAQALRRPRSAPVPVALPIAGPSANPGWRRARGRVAA